MRIVAIIQARMASTRLPGKVLLDIAGSPMLAHIVNRVRAAQRLHEVVVATSSDDVNAPIQQLCDQIGVACYRGEERDVLDRYYHAAMTAKADAVVRITGDCPLIDPYVIDDVVALFEGSGCDYASNTDPRSFPRGLDTEVFSFGALHQAWAEAVELSDREHVTTFIRRADVFARSNYRSDEDLSALRWTVDNACDLEFVRQVHAALGQAVFGMQDILNLLANRKELVRLESETGT